MIKKYSLVLVVCLCFVLSGFGQGSESFTNIPTTPNPGSYLNRFWTGTDGVIWNATNARTDQTINGKAICTNGNGTVTSPTYTGGMGILSFNYVRAFTGTGARNLQVWVNGTQIGSTITVSSTSNTVVSYNNAINITGSVSLELRTSGNQIKIDDISWTAASGGGCSITNSGITNISCNDNSTPGDASDDYITFDLDPTGATLGTNYTVSVSSGSITPTTAAYGSATTFTLQNGSAGAGDVTVTLTDDTDGSCDFDQLITDPGSCTSGSCSELFISEYVEGSGSTKYIEIYNPTNTSISLSSYFLDLYANGASSPNNHVSLSGTISAYGTVVYKNSSASAPGIDNAAVNFNGDDAIALLNGSNYIDIIGKIGEDPGTEWTGSGGRSTSDKTLRRKSTVQGGVTVNPASGFPTLDSEWEVYGTDDVSGLGAHTSDCEGPTPELQLTDTTPTDQACGFTLDAGSAETNVNTNDVSFYITNVGSADLEVTDLNLPAGDYTITVPAALPTVGSPLVIPASGSQIVTVHFAPTADGTITNTLTITSNDANEGSCSVNLTGEGYTPAPNIIVRGLVGSNPTIANGSGMGSVTFLNNTEFSAQTINVGSQLKNFRIDNTTGTAPLTVSSITLTGDTADFYVTANLTNPVAAGSSLDFTMTFAPTSASGDRFAQVTVSSNDPNKPTYTFYIKGTANCPSVTGSISPTEGPIGTEVTISSSGNDFVSATLNGTTLPIVSNVTGELVVTIPNTVTIGGSISVLLTNGCIFSTPFTLIDKTIGGCQAGNGTVDDLFISQVTDSPTGSLTYVELYNATGAAIDFSTTNYILKVYNNGNTTTPSNFIITINSGVAANNSTFVIAMGTSDSQCTGVTGADGSLNDIEITSVGVSINFFYKDSSNAIHLDRGHDFIGLYDASDTLIDAFGIFGDETWATGLGLGKSGANFERKTTASIPEPNFITTDWNVANWNDCTEVDYSGIGNYDYSVGLPPMSSDLSVSAGCNTATISVVGTEGYTEMDDTKELVYQWYYFNPADATMPEWKPISTGGIYTLSAAGDVLSLSDISGVLDYQFYCQVREDDATCYQASNAVKIKPVTVTWDGTHWNWSDGTLQDTMPNSGSYVILAEDYNTGIGGIQTSFEACNLVINANKMLRISDVDNGSATNTYVRVQNNITVDGEIYVDAKAALVQVDDSGTITLNSANAKNTLSKFTHPLANWYDYTYWSSPLEDVQIETALYQSKANRRYKYAASLFNDTQAEIGNTGTFNNGTSDDIDDNGDDWVNQQTGSMIPGVGYAATHNNDVPFTAGTSYQYVFEGTTASGGAFNTGTINVDIYINPSVTYNNWNLIGNPYPSAIDAKEFFNNTASYLEGVIYLWSHQTAPNSNASGNENENFSQNDYAMLNYVGGIAVGTPSVSGSSTPNGFIASGQSFFVIGNKSAVTSAGYYNYPAFNNAMRVTGNNTQFFRTSNAPEANKLWVNLTSDNGIFNQILVAYIDGATNGFDGMSYDAPRNLSTGLSSILYTEIPDSDKKYAIQGKDPNSLTLSEVIPIGFYTSITQATIYKLSIAQFEGDFFTNNTVYLKDKLLNLYHDLSASDYTFTSQTGEFNNRFEIVFQTDALSVGEQTLSNNDLSIIELTNGQVKFSIGHNLSITSVEILDVLGRRLYNLKGDSATEVYNLSNLSQAAYIAKVKLSNGQTLIKRAIKRQ
ncbi:MAG: lamin tail domain-containing protein [Gelidibacter sp.]